MSDGSSPTGDTPEADTEGLSEDFLFHFYQAGEMFRSGRLVEAKEQLEKAAQLKPDNGKCLNLLGLVYFKLGLYQRSIEIYRNLVDRFPADPTLRVNLATVYLKAGQVAEAERELNLAIGLKADHEKAHRTLAVVLMKQGEKERAREHLKQAGVEVSDRLMKSVWGVDGMMHQESVEPDLSEMEATIDQNIPQGGSWACQHGGAGPKPEEVPPPAAEPGAEPQQGPPQEQQGMHQGVQQGLPRRHLHALKAAASQMTFEVEDKGLKAFSGGRLYTRMNLVSWIEGSLSFSPVKKRFEHAETKYPFGTAERAMLLVEGPGALGFAPDERSFRVHALHDEPGYFIEEHIYAFSDTDEWENGQLPTEGETGIPVFHLQGPAQVVLLTTGKVSVRQLSGQGKIMVNVKKLAGWSGALVPRLFRATAPLPEELWLEITGTGQVFLMN